MVSPAIPAWIKNGVKQTQIGTKRKFKEPHPTLPKKVSSAMIPKALEDEVGQLILEEMPRENL
jgi:hypothetical protein